MRHWLSVLSLVAQGMGVALVPEALALAPLAGVRHLALQQRVAPSQTFAVWRGDGGAPVADLLAHLQGDAL